MLCTDTCYLPWALLFHKLYAVYYCMFCTMGMPGSYWGKPEQAPYAYPTLVSHPRKFCVIDHVQTITKNNISLCVGRTKANVGVLILYFPATRAISGQYLDIAQEGGSFDPHFDL